MLTLITSASSVLAQDREILVQGCASCRIIAERRLTLDVRDAPLSFIPMQVLRDSRGRHFLTVQGQVPLVFGPNGRFQRLLSRSGEGPGEFKSASFLMALPRDSLLVFDNQLARASVYSPDLKFVRTITLAFRVNTAALLQWPSRVAVNGVSYLAQERDILFHILDLTGAVANRIAAFGEHDGAVRPGDNSVLLRRFVHVEQDSFWAMHILEYELTHYSISGRVLDVIRRRPEWFADESRWSLGSPRQPPPPSLQTSAIRGDTLWVVSRVARPDWRKAWEGVNLSGVSEIASGRGPESTQLHMSRIEVIDLRGRRVLAQRDLQGIIVSLDSELRAALYDLDDRGEPRLSVLQLRLVK